MSIQYASIDACCLINILTAWPLLISPSQEVDDREENSPNCFWPQLYIPSNVANNEVLFIFENDAESDDEIKKVQVSLESFYPSGLLYPTYLESETEGALFVQLSMEMDDGEAACLAIAKQRNWSFATDDRKARRIASDLKVDLLDTTDLIYNWGIQTNVSKKNITAVLRHIRRYAFFIPNSSATHYSWWMDHLI